MLRAARRPNIFFTCGGGVEILHPGECNFCGCSFCVVFYTPVGVIFESVVFYTPEGVVYTPGVITPRV